MLRSTRTNLLILAAAGGIVTVLYGFALIGEHYTHIRAETVSVAQMDPARRLKAICDAIMDADSNAAGRDRSKAYISDAPVLREFASIYDLACGHKPLPEQKHQP